MRCHVCASIRGQEAHRPALLRIQGAFVRAFVAPVGSPIIGNTTFERTFAYHALAMPATGCGDQESTNSD